jgi:hypothetical protein
VILKILNDNCSSPYLIWNNDTRNELLEYCDTQLQLLRSGDIADMTYGSDFVYNLHSGELVVGKYIGFFFVSSKVNQILPLANPLLPRFRLYLCSGLQLGSLIPAR